MSQPRDLAALERELEQLKAQLPRHSLSPAMLARLEELEEEIAARQRAAEQAVPPPSERASS